MPTITISEETLEMIKDQIEDLEGEVKEVSSLDELIGEKVFIRTVTFHYLGKVKSRVGNFIHLEKASWVADSGRFADFLKDGVNDTCEIEPMKTVFVNLETVVDLSLWKHDLPTKQQ